jgi:glycosyltransferase involved in cell wall biosynthesis
MENPLRFCMITTFYPPYHFGGDALYVQNLSNELARRGHHVDIIHCIDSYRLLTRRAPVNCDNDHPNITVHGLKSPFGPLSPLATQLTGRPFLKAEKIRHILGKGYDVIHYHNISLVGGPKILEYGKGIKLYTMHEYWLICPTHVLFKFDREPCTSPECLRCILMHRRPPQLWRYSGLLERSVKHVDAFIAPSRFIRDTHLRAGLKARIEHLPNFLPDIDGEAHRSLQYNSETTSKGPYFLFVGRLEKIKGVQTIIPVFRHYSKARLLIAGTGAFETELRKQAEGINNIEFLGFLSRNRLQELYKNAVAVLVPSLCFEVFSTVILEAFRQRVSVIVRRTGDMAEVVEESGGGIFYDTDKELTDSMDKLLEDAGYRRELGSRGRRAFQKKWSAEAHINNYLALINNIRT